MLTQIRPLETEKIRVLVVDDEPELLELLAESLTGAGFEVRSAPSAEKGLAQFRSFHPDLVVSDILMPGTSGLKMAELMRCERSEFALIFLSGNPSTQYSQLAYKVLEKPVRMRDLISVCRSASSKELPSMPTVSSVAA